MKCVSHELLLQGNVCQHSLVWILLIIVKYAPLKKNTLPYITLHSSTANTLYPYSS